MTSETPDALLLDLLPATSYSLSVRARGPKPANWTSLGPMVTCTTDKADSPTYGLDVLLPPRTVDTHGGFTITLSKPAPSEEAWFAHYRYVAAPLCVGNCRLLTSTTTQSFPSLQPSSDYEVYIKSNLRHIILNRPSSSTALPLRRRRSSRCTALVSCVATRASRTCSMITIRASCSPISRLLPTSPPPAPHTAITLNITFNGSVVTRYCVERAVPKDQRSLTIRAAMGRGPRTTNASATTGSTDASGG